MCHGPEAARAQHRPLLGQHPGMGWPPLRKGRCGASSPRWVSLPARSWPGEKGFCPGSPGPCQSPRGSCWVQAEGQPLHCQPPFARCGQQQGTGSVSTRLCAGTGATTSRTWPGLWVSQGAACPYRHRVAQEGWLRAVWPQGCPQQLPALALKAERGAGEGTCWAGSEAVSQLCHWPGFGLSPQPGGGSRATSWLCCGPGWPSGQGRGLAGALGSGVAPGPSPSRAAGQGSHRARAGLGWEGRRRGWARRDPAH